MKKKLCIITDTRAEYGLLKNLIKGIQKDKRFHLTLIATSMHLSKKHGLTYKEIIRDGFKINHKINLNLKKDSRFQISKSLGGSIESFSKIFNSNKPDLIIILGDRYEILPPAIVALMYNIPIAHIGGGELTEGAFDNSIRHCITKLSHFHFVVHKSSRRRLIQMGELPKNIFVTGGLGVDAIKNTKFLSKNELEKKLKFKIKDNNIMITYHPVTLEKDTSRKDFREILLAVKKFKNTSIIFTMPNSDPGNNVIFSMIKSFVKKNKNSKYFVNLGHLKYFSCLKYSKCVLGNSSSGIHEVPAFKIPSINIGNRQKGRIKFIYVINCKPQKKSILQALKKADLLYKNKRLIKIQSPYGKAGATKKILKILKSLSLKNVIQKNFFDIKGKNDFEK